MTGKGKALGLQLFEGKGLLHIVVSGDGGTWWGACGHRAKIPTPAHWEPWRVFRARDGAQMRQICSACYVVRVDDPLQALVVAGKRGSVQGG